MYCIVNGDLIPVEKATIGIRDLALIRGYGIFDFFRLSSGVPLFFDEHLGRFYKGAVDVRLKMPVSQSELKKMLEKLFLKNSMPTSGVRMILTGGYTPNGYDIGKPNLIVTQEPITFPSDEKYNNGVKLITYEYLRDIPDVKTINYMTGIWLRDKINAHGAYDVIYTHKGSALELTRSNIFVVSDTGEIITPKAHVLHGITRKKLIEKTAGRFNVIQRRLEISELLQAKEAFLTGTTKRVLPITQIDDQIIGTGKLGNITIEMMKHFRECEEAFVNAN